MESRAKKDITGCRSGRLVAIEPTEEKRNGSTLWRCRCDCGKEILLEAYQITGEKVKSCGCLRSEKRIKDLTGQRFGKLTALERLDQKSNRSYLWRCVCDCGNEITVRANALTTGNTKSCGCVKQKVLQERAKDISGKRYGSLTAVRPTGKRRHASVVWECRCDCGRTAEYSYAELEYSHIMSCGCEQHPSVPLPLTYIEGTCVEMLENKKLRRDNTSGHTGVVLTKRGWVAKINFKGKLYYLGTYQDFALAVKARERAEEELHGSFLDWYYVTYSDSNKDLADKTAPA